MSRPRVSCPRITIFIASVLALLATPLVAFAQCPGSTLTGGLQGPSKMVQTSLGNLIVAETGTPAPNSGRVSIVGLDGSRRSLLEGLPSGLNSQGDFSGTQGVYLSGRTLYVLNGEGNATLAGPLPGTELPNPTPNSPLISSVLAVRFSSATEKGTSGFVLTPADHQALKNGETLKFSNGGTDSLTVELVADFPNFVPDPLPFFPANVRHSNPFGIVAVGNDLYIADGGRNALLKVDASSGITSVLTTFPSIPNPTPFGPPFIEAVPDSVHEYDGDLLVTLLRGFPFLSGNSVVLRINRNTGVATPFISGLTSAIDTATVKIRGWTCVYTLEVSLNLLAGEPGRLQRFQTASTPGVPISTCLIGPSSMVRDEKTGTIYISEIFTGRIIQIPGL